MRVLIVGSDEIHAIENFFVKYMTEAGVAVQNFTAHRFFNEYFYAGVFNKIKYRLGISRIFSRINASFLEAVEAFKPDIVFVFKGMELFPETLSKLRAQGVRLVNFNPDNPFLFTGPGSGNSNIVESRGLYDLHFTYNLEVRKKFIEEYQARVAYLPFGYDIPDGVYEQVAREPEIMQACFLGNPDPARAAFLDRLATQGIPLHVYGHRDWKRLLKSDNITLSAPVYGLEQWKALRRYRIQLNMMRIHNENSHNMRTFEVPAIGGIMLAHDTPEHRMFFENGKEAFFYRDADECVALSKKLLNLSAEEASAIRTNARQRSITSGYSYRDRTLQAIDEMKKLLGKKKDND